MDIQPYGGVVVETITINAATVIMALFAVINLAGLGLLGVLLWVARSAIADLRSVERGLNQVRQDLPREYIRKEDYGRDIREIKDMLTRLFERLDTKADKHQGTG